MSQADRKNTQKRKSLEKFKILTCSEYVKQAKYQSH